MKPYKDPDEYFPNHATDRLDQVYYYICKMYGRVDTLELSKKLRVDVPKLQDTANALRKNGYNIPKVKTLKEVIIKSDEEMFNLKEILEIAKKNILQHSELQPVAMIEAEKEEDNAVIALLYSNTDEKISAFNKVKDLSKKLNAKSVVFVQDTWMKTIEKKDISKYDMSRPVSQQEGRVDAILVIKQDKDGNAESIVLPYEKDNTGKITFQKEQESKFDKKHPLDGNMKMF